MSDIQTFYMNRMYSNIKNKMEKVRAEYCNIPKCRELSSVYSQEGTPTNHQNPPPE